MWKKVIPMLLVLMVLCSACGKMEDSSKETISMEVHTVEDSWKTIQEYGFENGYSVLSYRLNGETLKDCGEYYSIEATFSKPVKVPGNLQVGDTCKIVINDFTGETVEVTYSTEGYLTSEDGMEIYYYPPEDGSDTEIYQGSADRIDSPFYNGILHIRKDAVTGAAITGQPYVTITQEELAYRNWFNGLAFDESGMVTELIYFGD